MPRVIVLASMNMDLTAYTESLPRPAETVFGNAIGYSPGGKGLNQAVAARRLGAEVAVIGYLGRDDFGDRVNAFLAGEGIATGAVGRLGDQATGLAVITVDAASQNAIVVIPGANKAWPDGAARQFAAERGDLVLAQFEIPDAAIVDGFARARAAGASTCLNPAPAKPVPAELLALTDQLIVNEIELPTVLGRPVDPADVGAVRSAARELACGRQAVVVTIGRAGAVIATEHTSWMVPGVRVSAVDTTAAGDCFIGAWAAALAGGRDLRAAAEFANAAAAISVTRRGAALSLPRLDEVPRS